MRKPGPSADSLRSVDIPELLGPDATSIYDQPPAKPQLATCARRAMVVLAPDGRLTVTYDVEVSDDFLRSLAVNKIGSDAVREERKAVTAAMSDAARCLVRTIKFAAHHVQLHDVLTQSKPGFEWCDPATGAWRPFSDIDSYMANVAMRTTLGLDDPNTVTALN